MRPSSIAFKVTAALGVVAGMGTGTAVAQPVHWEDCGPVAGVPSEDVPQDPPIQCARVEVPVDYAHPDGPKTSIAVSRIQATSGTSRSTIFGNPGGPGASALAYWTRRGELPAPAGLYENHDLVAVQPRGLTGSDPLACNPQYLGPRTISALHDACYGTDPAYMASLTTETEARDTDAVREALGLARIDYVGQSYGTAIAADYATLFPEHTGRVVLDSAVDPEHAWGRMAADTTLAQEGRVNDMFGWIAERDDYYHLGDTPLKVYYSWKWIVDQEVGGAPNLTPPPAESRDLPVELRGTPVERPALDVINSTAPGRTRVEGFARAITGQDLLNNAATGVFDSTVGATGTDQAWPMLAHMLRYYNDGGRIARVDYGTAAKMLAAKRLSPALDTRAGVYQSVVCNENGTGVDALAVGAARVDRLLGGNALVDKAADQAAGGECLGWKPVTTPVRVDGSRLAEQPLLINSRHDTRTPLSGAEVMARLMGANRVTVEGGDHGTFRGGNTAADRLVMAYLEGEDVVDGTVLPGKAAPQPLPKWGPAERAAAGQGGRGASVPGTWAAAAQQATQRDATDATDAADATDSTAAAGPAVSRPVPGADDWYGAGDVLGGTAGDAVSAAADDATAAAEQAGARADAAARQAREQLDEAARHAGETVNALVTPSAAGAATTATTTPAPVPAVR